MAAVGDIYYRHHSRLIIDPENHPVGATASAEPRRMESVRRALRRCAVIISLRAAPCGAVP